MDMKPFKTGKGVANWLLRITLATAIYTLYVNILSTFAFTSLSFLIALGITIFGVLIIIGGFTAKPTLTVIAGLAITLITIYKIIISFNGNFDHYLISQLIPLSIGFYFFTNGNDRWTEHVLQKHNRAYKLNEVKPVFTKPTYELHPALKKRFCTDEKWHSIWLMCLKRERKILIL